jgi:putative endonuclease
MSKTYFVYIAANKPGGILYIGITNDLSRRIEEHSLGIENSFTKKYNVHILVYYETTENIVSAIAREKQLKHWNRSWKIRLIKTENPQWKDLSEDF